MAGHDRQLETAVKLMLDKLASQPHVRAATAAVAAGLSSARPGLNRPMPEFALPPRLRPIVLPVVTAWTVRDAQEATLPRAAPCAVTAAEIPGIRALLALQVGVVVIVALMLAREVLIPLTLAMLLSFLLAPLTSLLRRVRLGRAPASIALGAAGAGAARRIVLADRRADGQASARTSPAMRRSSSTSWTCCAPPAQGRNGRRPNGCGRQIEHLTSAAPVHAGNRRIRPREGRARTGAGGARSVADGGGAQCRGEPSSRLWPRRSSCWW